MTIMMILCLRVQLLIVRTMHILGRPTGMRATSTTWTCVEKFPHMNVATTTLYRPARWRRPETWRRWLEDIRTRCYGNVKILFLFLLCHDFSRGTKHWMSILKGKASWHSSRFLSALLLGHYSIILKYNKLANNNNDLSSHRYPFLVVLFMTLFLLPPVSNDTW